MKKIFGLALVAVLALAAAPATAQFYGGYGGFGGFQSSSNAYFNYLALLRYKAALADGENMTKYWKGDSYIGATFGAPFNYKVKVEDFYKTDDALNKGAKDSVFSGVAAPKVGLFVDGSSDHMLFMLSETSILSLSVGVHFSYSHWEGNDPYYRAQDGHPAAFSTLSIGLPVTFDYKSGCDVNFRPEQRTCWAVGAGVIPTYYSYGVNDFAATGAFRVQPYAYASFGFYMGVCAKIKAGCIPFTGSLQTTSGSGPGTPHFYADGVRPMFFLGLGIMSHSQDWNKGSAERRSLFGQNSGGGRRGSRGGRGINGRMF